MESVGITVHISTLFSLKLHRDITVLRSKEDLRNHGEGRRPQEFFTVLHLVILKYSKHNV